MTSDILLRFFPGATNELEQQLILQFEKLEAIANLFYAIVIDEGGKYKVGYASPSAETLTGHPLANFSYHGGFAFIYSITPPTYRMLVLEQETYYMKKARQPDFCATSPFIVDIQGALEHCDHTTMQARLVSVFLEFTALRTPKLAINAWQITDDLPEDLLPASRMEIEMTLRAIQRIHLQLNNKKFSEFNGDHALRLSYSLYDLEEITKQEYRVLKLLSDGHSTKIIADKLNISVNTVESHRRHLLQKFKALNVAEMIKKATKLFWLE